MPTTQAPLPKYSLPRYADPTPSAAHRKLPREEEADLALKNTKFTPGTRQTLIALFLLTIVAVPADSACWRISRGGLDQPLADDFHLQIAAMAPPSRRSETRRAHVGKRVVSLAMALAARAISAHCAARRWQRAGLFGSRSLAVLSR